MFLSCSIESNKRGQGLICDQATNVNHFGPYVLYVSTAWDTYLDSDYTTGYPKTVRSRISEVSNITAIKTLDYLGTTAQPYQVLLVQMSSDVVREVIGMDITMVQWESKGGLQLNFKVMAIMVPQLRADQLSQTGIVHGTVQYFSDSCLCV